MLMWMSIDIHGSVNLVVEADNMPLRISSSIVGLIPAWEHALCDSHIFVLSLGVVYIRYLYVCEFLCNTGFILSTAIVKKIE